GLKYAFPQLRFTPRFVSFAMLKQTFSYGVHTFFANIASQLLDQTPPFVIGAFLPAKFIGFYSFPLRLLSYAMEFIARAGQVSSSRAAAYDAQGKKNQVYHLASFSNRYALAVFTPVAIFLLFYGGPFIHSWVKVDEFARNSAVLLPVLLVG